MLSSLQATETVSTIRLIKAGCMHFRSVEDLNRQKKNLFLGLIKTLRMITMCHSLNTQGEKEAVDEVMQWRYF